MDKQGQKLTIDYVLSRGVDKVLPNKEGLAEVMEKKKIRLYLGIDPTGSQLHLGHGVVLRKLQQFVELGHEVILLIGNGTVKIGDPTGKDETRPVLTDKQINEHFKTWKSQAESILDFDKIKVLHNGDWLDSIKLPELIKISSQTTVQQLLERDMFQERIEEGKPIHTHELLYPILQGYDAVEMEVDLEIGGSDQMFNMLVGRQMLKKMKDKEKYVLTVSLLTGSDGRKMGKSLNNFIGLDEAPEDVYGKTMSIVDELIGHYMFLLTDIPQKEVKKIERDVEEGSVNPIEPKKRLAFMVTKMLYGEDKAKQAEGHFERTVQGGKLPEDMPKLEVSGKRVAVLDLVMQTGVIESKSQGRRMIKQGGVSLEGESVQNFSQQVDVKNGDILKVGRRNYFELKIGEE